MAYIIYFFCNYFWLENWRIRNCPQNIPNIDTEGVKEIEQPLRKEQKEEKKKEQEKRKKKNRTDKKVQPTELLQQLL